MKKLYLVTLVIVLISAVQLQAQVSAYTYQFTNTTGTYTNLTGATQTASNTSFDDVIVPIGFPFYHYGVRYDTLKIFGDGEVTMINASGTYDSYFNPFYTFADTNGDFATTGAYYKVSGSAGSRVFVAEWRTLTIGHNASVWNHDYATFQLALFEGSNIFEFRYGPTVVTETDDFWPNTGPYIYYDIEALTPPALHKGFLLYGNPASPSLNSSPLDDVAIDAAPANGRIYRFTPTTTGIEKTIPGFAFDLFPNPASGTVNLKLDASISNAQVTVADLTGRKVSELNLTGNPGNVKLDTGNLTDGIYLVTVTSGERSETRKLVVSGAK